jgi:hypothetical protein
MRITVRTLMFLAAAATAGCGSDYEAGILTSYGEGYSDGCDSAYSDLGISGFEYSSGGLFGGDYGSGWDEGYRDCEAFMRAAAL